MSELGDIIRKRSINFHIYADDSIKIKIGDQILSASSNVRGLGVVIDSLFNMDAHVALVCKSCYFHMRNIVLLNLILIFTAFQIIHAFITSRLDYCN